MYLLGPRERSPTRKNVAVGQPQLGAAIQVSASESAMDAPRHRGPALLIARASQPGKFKGGLARKTSSFLTTQTRRVHLCAVCFYRLTLTQAPD